MACRHVACPTAADLALGAVTPMGIAAFVAAAFLHLPLPVAWLYSLALRWPCWPSTHTRPRGQGWWECVQAAHPQQSVGMVAYIYVPATVTFSTMFFGATLWLRRIVGDLVFGGVFRGVPRRSWHGAPAGGAHPRGLDAEALPALPGAGRGHVAGRAGGFPGHVGACAVDPQEAAGAGGGRVTCPC